MPDLIEPDLIEKEQPVPAAQAATRACDPVTLEIVRGAIRAAQAEMEALIERAAISAFIREKKDFYTALFDADGVLPPGSGARSRERLAVHFASGTAEVALFDRVSLGAGDRIAGPAILCQLDATTLVLPGWTGDVHPSGAILLAR